MHRRALANAAGSFLLAAMACAQDPPQTEPPAMTIRCDRPGIAISPVLHGIFFEEINHAGEGGLYSELLRNRAIEEPPGADGIPPGWSVDTPPDGAASIARDADRPHNAKAPNALRLSVTKVAGAVVNAGHFGVPIKADADYRLRFDARKSADAPERVIASLTSRKGEVYSEAELRGVGTDWRRFEILLRSPVTDADARFALTLLGSGTVWFDTVSLTPRDTFRLQPMGFRRDLMEMLQALRPEFVRFPGGCYVEGGDRLADAFRWQDTLGDIAERKGHHNANWGYWSTDGLGYHEYLELCAALRAAPMFVVNCGMSHREVVPMGELEPWLQSALDAIEYANGGTDTKWGAVRAANGRAEPFGLKFVEIGNENGMFDSFGGTKEQYAERYERFRQAIEAQWPDVVTIANVRVDQPMEVVDDHFYQSSGWFWAEMDRYAVADRNGPKVYVGEYAVTGNPGRTGNLRAALGEAAFLCGLERHGDVVIMASYAPLFVHVQDRKWNPDLIQFDGLRACGTPSYQAQVLFARHRADTLLPVALPEFATAEATAGTIGLGTWNTQAEYRDVTVEQDGKAVYQSDFAAGTASWRPVEGDWAVADGALAQTQGGDMRWTFLDLPALRAASDYTVRCKAKKRGGAEGFLLMFHVGDAQNWTWFNVGGWGNREHALERMADGSKFGVGPRVPGEVVDGVWHDLRVELQKGRIRTFVDGKPIHDVEDRALPSFTAVAGRVAASGDVVLKVVNGSSQDRTVTLRLEGAAALHPEARGEVLTAASLDAENTLDAPANVVLRPFTVATGEAMQVTFAARSVTGLRFRPKAR
jgi:alpha-L-arabinofuranosidase